MVALSLLIGMVVAILSRLVQIFGFLGQSEDHSQSTMAAISTGKTVVVIGANRGIGLNLLKKFQSRGWQAVGTMRPDSKSDPSYDDLKATGARIVYLDYKNESSIMNAAAELNDTKIDVLVNCAGIAVQPPEWEAHGAADLLERFQVMAIGPFLAIKHFLPLILKNGGGKIANMSSISGSISDNDDGRLVGYKMAKAALNQLTVTLANDFRKTERPISIVALQPGWIKTKLSRWTGKVDMDESVTGMTDIIEGLKPEQSGAFYDWKGQTMPW